MMLLKPTSISKILSPNDAGETTTHQAGILIPKDTLLLSFFPVLDVKIYNPRVALLFYDAEHLKWRLNFIYYNNAAFGKTRDEYRLTGLTRYIRTNNIRSGDTIILGCAETGEYTINHERRQSLRGAEMPIVLSNNWKVVSL
jgi:hypothetical protein